MWADVPAIPTASDWRVWTTQALSPRPGLASHGDGVERGVAFVCVNVRRLDDGEAQLVSSCVAQHREVFPMLVEPHAVGRGAKVRKAAVDVAPLGPEPVSDASRHEDEALQYVSPNPRSLGKTRSFSSQRPVLRLTLTTRSSPMLIGVGLVPSLSSWRSPS